MKKILGMGNALVDILTPIDDDRLLEFLALPKGSMQLVDVSKTAEIEEKIREWAARDSALIVVTGPVITRGMPTIGASHVAVPTAFFKVVLSPFTTPMRAIGFIYPNKSANGPLKRYAVSVDEVERRTGIDFFSALPDDIENKTESQLNLDVWTH